MNIKLRLKKLESAMIKPETIRIANFIVEPGNLDPIGYVCDEVTIIREPGESDAALHKRCSDSVIWPDITRRHIFEPLQRSVCH